MSVVTAPDLRITAADKAATTTTAARTTATTTTRLPLDTTLDLATNRTSGYIEWPALIEQLQKDRVCKTQVEAAIYIRGLLDTGRLYMIPCALTGGVCFSRKQIKSSVIITSEDERQIKDQDFDYVKTLCRYRA